MLAQRLLGFKNWSLLGLVVGPINLAVFQVAQIDLANGWLLVDQRVFCVGTPVIGGANDQSMGERFFARGREKAVNVSLLKPVVGCIQLALDGMKFACVGLCHQIDTGIVSAEALA